MVTKHRRPESILLFVDKRLLRPVLPLQAYGLTPSPTGSDQHAIMRPSTNMMTSMFKPKVNFHRRSRLQELAIPTANSSIIKADLTNASRTPRDSGNDLVRGVPRRGTLVAMGRRDGARLQ